MDEDASGRGEQGSPPAPDAAGFDPMAVGYGLPYLVHCLRADIAYARRHEEPLSLIVLALDHVGDIEQTVGQGAADGALEAVGMVVRRESRTEDMVARIDERTFGVTCRSTPGEAAWFLANRLRQAVESAAFAHDGQELPLTVSLGVVSLASDDVDAESFIASAVGMLGEAAEDGGNRVKSRPPPGV